MRSPVKRIPNGAVGSNPTPFKKKAVVAELVYAHVLEACVLWLESSSLSNCSATRYKTEIYMKVRPSRVYNSVIDKVAKQEPKQVLGGKEV